MHEVRRLLQLSLARPCGGEAVGRGLHDRGLRVFLDRWYLAAGQPWPQALEQTLAACSAVAVFLGADGLGPWQQRERDLALDRQGREPGFPVIPVLLTRADPAWVSSSSTPGSIFGGRADESALQILCRRHPRRAARARGPAADRRRPRRRSAPTAACGRSARRTSRSSSAARHSPRRWSRRSRASRSSPSSAPPAAASRRWCAPA